MGCLPCAAQREKWGRTRKRKRALKELIRRLRDDDPTLTDIDISCWKITDRQLKTISNALEYNHYLRRLDVQSNQITDKGVDHLANALQKNRYLHELWIGRNPKVTERGIEALSQALCRNVGLERLSLEKIGPQVVGINACFGRSNKLERLYLGQNELGDDGIGNICKSLRQNARTNTIKILSLNDNNIENHGATSIGKMLRDVNNLECLNLRNNKIDNDGVAQIASGLRKNGYNTVNMLRLGHNQIDDQGASFLSDALVDNHTLEKLDLEGNALGVVGAESLAKALESNSTLLVLSLGYNSISNKFEPNMDWLKYKSIGDDGARYLADALKINTTLKVIGLERGGVRDEGAIALAEALRVNDSLRTMHMDENVIGERGFEALTDAMRVNHTFHKISGMKTEMMQQKEMRKLCKINRDCMDAAMAREQKYQVFGYDDGRRSNNFDDYIEKKRKNVR